MVGGDSSEGQRELVHRLGERIKELTALHGAARLLLQNRALGVPELQALVELLPPAMQYPEVASAHLRYGAWSAATPGYAPTAWTLRQELRTQVSPRTSRPGRSTRA